MDVGSWLHPSHPSNLQHPQHPQPTTHTPDAKLFASPIYKDWRWRAKLHPTLRLNKDLQFSLPFQAHAANVQAYVNQCELESKVEPGTIPPFYAASTFLYPTVCLLSRRQYLCPVLGAIHVANFFRFQKPLALEAEYTGMLKVQESVGLSKKKGVEVTFPQVLLDQHGKEVWRSTTTVLVPCRNPHYDRAAASASKRLSMEEELQAQGLKPTLVRTVEFQTAADTGRRFAAVVSDYNPIHLYSWSAKLFGFKKAIAHGMYVGARALHEALDIWAEDGGKYPVEADVKFIRPCFLGKAVVVKVFRVQDKKEGKRLMLVATEKGKEDTVHLTATVRGARADQ